MDYPLHPERFRRVSDGDEEDRRHLEELRKERGSHFDPSLVNSFAGIADGLHEEISKAGDELLEAAMDELIGRYFSVELPFFDSRNSCPVRR